MNDNVDNQVNDNERDSVGKQLDDIQGNTLETDNGNSIIGFEDFVMSGAPQEFERGKCKTADYYIIVSI